MWAMPKRPDHELQQDLRVDAAAIGAFPFRLKIAVSFLSKLTLCLFDAFVSQLPLSI